MVKAGTVVAVAGIGALLVGGYFLIKPFADAFGAISKVPEQIGEALKGANQSAQQGAQTYFLSAYPNYSGGQPVEYITNPDGSVKKDLTGAPVFNIGVSGAQKAVAQGYSDASGKNLLNMNVSDAVFKNIYGKSPQPVASNPASIQKTQDFFLTSKSSNQKEVASFFGLKASQINPAVNNVSKSGVYTPPKGADPVQDTLKNIKAGNVFNVATQKWVKK